MKKKKRTYYKYYVRTEWEHNIGIELLPLWCICAALLLWLTTKNQDLETIPSLYTILGFVMISIIVTYLVHKLLYYLFTRKKYVEVIT